MYEFLALILGAVIGMWVRVLPRNTISAVFGAIGFGALIIASGAVIKRFKFLRNSIPFLAERNTAPEPLNGYPGYELYNIGITDQGTLWCPKQLASIDHRIRTEKNDVTIVVYVHGWQNGPNSADKSKFQNLLQRLAEPDEQRGSLPEQKKRFIGVYLYWNGQTFTGPFKIVSFWNRQQTLSNAAQGGAREVFEMLRAWRYQASSMATERHVTDNVSRKLVVVGHSFGGAIVFQALAQSLFGIIADGTPLRPPADCVLLVNPALSATIYLPLHEAAIRRPPIRKMDGQDSRPFRFIAVTAMNDRAVGLHFPLAQLRRLYMEVVTGRSEAEALLRGMGFMSLFQTGRLRVEDGQAVMSRPIGAADDPLFQVLTATPDVVDGHGGIDKAIFVDWVQKTIVETV